MALEHEAITEKIIGAAFEIRNDSNDEAQLTNELKATRIRVGLLINFGNERVEFKRLVYSKKSAFDPRQSVAELKPHNLLQIKITPLLQWCKA